MNQSAVPRATEEFLHNLVVMRALRGRRPRLLGCRLLLLFYSTRQAPRGVMLGTAG